jgi:hypothetical protein
LLSQYKAGSIRIVAKSALFSGWGYQTYLATDMQMIVIASSTPAAR